MPSFNTTTRTFPGFSLLCLFCWWILSHNVLLIFCCVFILTLIIPWCIVTFLLTFCFSITFFCFTIMTNVWTIRCEMSFFITTETNNFWQIIICRSIICSVGRFILWWFLTIICWLWWFGSGLIRLLSSWRTVIGIMTWLFTTETHNLVRISIVC